MFLKEKLLMMLFSITIWTFILSGCSFFGFGGFEFDIEDGEVTLISYSGRDSYLEIPSTYKELPVTAIGPEAFRNATSLISVVIPEGVTKIGHGAFLYSSNLESIIIPDSLKIIEHSAFAYASSLKHITIPEGVESIEKFAFLECRSLESVILPSTLTIIKDDAFRGNHKLETILIPDGVLSIGNSVFYDCFNLETITMSKNVESIGIYAFVNCDNLKSIDLPESLMEIGEGAFREAASLEEINVAPNNIYYSSEDGVLYDKEKTTLILYPMGKTDESYTFPNSLQIINSFIIPNKHIKTIYIPKSVVIIDSYAFSDCHGLEAIISSEENPSYSSEDGVLFNKDKTLFHTYPKNKKDTEYVVPNSVTLIPGRLFLNCSNLISVFIPEGVISIGSQAFEGCKNLESVTLPASLNKIEIYAFKDSSSLISIFIPINVTVIESRVFENCSSLTIYVEVSSQPTGWENRWNMSDRPVVWGASR